MPGLHPARIPVSLSTNCPSASTQPCHGSRGMHSRPAPFLSTALPTLATLATTPAARLHWIRGAIAYAGCELSLSIAANDSRQLQCILITLHLQTISATRLTSTYILDIDIAVPCGLLYLPQVRCHCIAHRLPVPIQHHATSLSILLRRHVAMIRQRILHLPAPVNTPSQGFPIRLHATYLPKRAPSCLLNRPSRPFSDCTVLRENA